MLRKTPTGNLSRQERAHKSGPGEGLCFVIKLIHSQQFLGIESSWGGVFFCFSESVESHCYVIAACELERRGEFALSLCSYRVFGVGGCCDCYTRHRGGVVAAQALLTPATSDGRVTAQIFLTGPVRKSGAVVSQTRCVAGMLERDNDGNMKKTTRTNVMSICRGCLCMRHVLVARCMLAASGEMLSFE